MGNSAVRMDDKVHSTINDRRGFGEETEEPSPRSVGDHNKKIWRVKDVAGFLGCSIGHVYNLVADEKIPRIKKGKFIYFVPEHILEWVLEGDLK